MPWIVRDRSRHRAVTTLAAAALIVVTLVLPGAGDSAEQHTYDAVGRLTRVTYDDGTSIVYSYDANSNLLSVQVLADDLFKDGFE